MAIAGIMSELKGIMDTASAKYVPTTLPEMVGPLLPVLVLAQQLTDRANDSGHAMQIMEGKVEVV